MQLKTKIILGAIGSVVALAIFGNVMHNIEARNIEATAQAAQAAKQKMARDNRSALVAELAANKPLLLEKGQLLIDAGQPDAALVSLSGYSQLNDPDIGSLQARAKTAQTVKKLSDELATKPNPVRMLAIYQELAAVQPSNQLWSVMAGEVRPLVEASQAQQAKADLAAARQEAVKRLFSSWDGSVHVVERAIKAQLKDPDSYKHVETKYVDSGSGNVTVLTQYRARNSFNAIVPGAVAAVVTPEGELVSFTPKN